MVLPETEAGGDFAAVVGPTKPIGRGINSKGDSGKKREYLKVFETLPVQLLNAYGQSKFARTSDEDVWKHFAVPQKTGAEWMTEYCSKSPERRGIAINRWLLCMQNYLKHQLEEDVKTQNKALIDAAKFKEIYKEIEGILPSIDYCLAPKKVSEKTGASSLRSAAVSIADTKNVRDPKDLDEHAKKLYDWLDTGKVSRIRMLVNWQSAGGLSFVAGCHHRASVCFRGHGNSLHEEHDSTVSLEEFQDAVKSRHRVGSRGIADGESQANDWGPTASTG